MTSKRTAGFDLAEAVRDPSFTPRVRDAGALVEALAGADEDLARRIERALARLGAAGASAVLARVPGAEPPLRGRLARALGRIAAAGSDDRHVEALVALLDDPDPKASRSAAIALGRIPRAGVEDALLRRWDRETRPGHLRAIAGALGKVGTDRSLGRLEDADARSGDAGLGRIADRAVLTITRSLGRDRPSRVDADAAFPSGTRVRFECRAGLDRLLCEELVERSAALRPRVVRPGVVEAEAEGPASRLLRVRTMLRFGFPLPAEHGELAAAAARALASDPAARLLGALTIGPVRYRIDWAGGGHRRAAVWTCARAVADSRHDLVNDPRDATWEAVVHEDGPEVLVVLRPRKIADGRFSYRLGDVPAASHPTLSAALARVAGVRGDDVVWDPFAGSGTELIERALLGPFAELHGTDRDPAATGTARANLRAAGVAGGRGAARLVVGDALAHRVPGVTLVITNPPMGRRVLRGDIGPLLDRLVDHVAGQLRPGGRLVWISPLPRRTAARAERAGLAVVFRQEVDMGGFGAEIQRCDAPG